MRGLQPFAACVVLLSTSAAALAADLRVPEDFSDLKAALSAAQSGDRVLVQGGRWRNGRLTRTGVAIIGKNAVLSGDWEVSGTGASIESCTFRDFHLEVMADGVTLRDNVFIAPRYTEAVDARGVTDFLFEGNRSKLVAIYAYDSTNAVARGNRLAGGEIALFGANPLIEDNVCSRTAQVSVFDGAGGIVRRNRTPNIFAWGVTSASIQDNTITGGLIDVRGDSAGVEANRLLGASTMHVEGDFAFVHANTGSVGRTGVVVSGGAPVVLDNRLARRGITTRSASAVLLVNGTAPGSVLGNELTHDRTEGLLVLGDGHEVSDNVIHGVSCLDSIRIDGSSSSVWRNLIDQTGGRLGTGSGIVVEGDSSTIADNVVTGALYDGIVVAGAGDVLSGNEVRDSGRCGITISAGSDLVFLTDCTVSGAAWSAAFNLGDRTTFAGGSYVGGIKVDVLDLGGATQFANAVFATKSVDPALAPFR